MFLNTMEIGLYPTRLNLPALMMYGKIAVAWRDGRAAEGACLENMFGSHQRGFESHSLRQAIVD